jgi:hypothetical protein
MPSKPSSNRKSPTRKPATPVRARQTAQRKTAAAVVADADDEDQGALAQRASEMREIARRHEGSVVVTALVTGFSLGLVLGGLLIHSKMRGHWPDRSSLQATGRRILNQVESHIPESIRDKVGLS